MDAARIESWLLNDKEIRDSSLRTDYTSCLRRPKNMVPSAYPDRDWTNPNRFSDPLNRTSRFSNAMGLSLPARPDKAYTWCLDKELQWRLKSSRSTMGSANKQSSLFGYQGCSSTNSLKPTYCADEDSTRKRRNGASYTWERVRQQGYHRPACYQSGTEEASLTSDHLSPRDIVNKRAGVISFNGRQGCGDHLSGVYPTRLNCQQNISYNSINSSPRPSRHALGSHLSNNRGTSPCGSQRSSPSLSPRSTLAHLSPGLFRRYSPNARQGSPLHSTLSPSHGGGAQISPAQTNSPRTSFISQWLSKSSSPSFQTSPFSARSSQTSSGHDDGDFSFGSETDDDFLYISCKQLTQGLADLSMAPSKNLGHTRNMRVVENPTFVASTDDGEFGDDDDNFEGCSDDALSDDVFLDNPKSQSVTRPSLSLSQSSSPTSQQATGKDADSEELSHDLAQGADVEHPALASLRRNSLQNKLRQTWRHRRNKANCHKAGKKLAEDTCTESSATSSPSSNQTDLQAFSSTNEACPNDINSDPPPTEDNMADEPPETKPSFYYVISPTDDVNMPDVIAVRRSSVELIRWKNSLRRRRRRQAKRHDLGKSKKKEAKQTATV